MITSRRFRRKSPLTQPAVECVLVDHARLAVHRDELGLEPARVRMFQKVCEHLVEHDIDTVWMPCQFLPP